MKTINETFLQIRIIFSKLIVEFKNRNRFSQFEIIVDQKSN